VAEEGGGEVIVIADLHLGDTHDTVQLGTVVLGEFKYVGKLGSLDNRTYQTLLRLEEVMKLCHNTRQALVIAGDVFHTSRPDPAVVAEFIRIVGPNEWGSRVKVHLLTGNHDTDSDSNVMDMLNEALPTCAVIREPMVIDIGGQLVGMWPHMNILDRRVHPSADLSPEDLARVSLVITHASPLGMVFSDDETSRVNLLDASKFVGKTVVSGHPHAPFHGSWGGAKLLVPGSVSCTSFDNWDKPGGYIEIAKGKATFKAFDTSLAGYCQVSVSDVFDLGSVVKQVLTSVRFGSSKIVLLKLILNVSKRADVDEVGIRKFFTEYSGPKGIKIVLSKLEVRVETNAMRSNRDGKSRKARKVELGVRNPGTYLKDWLAEQDGPAKVKTLALKTGLQIIETTKE
jgi:DNA repair exonuclease SbcCD nuclease subunit